MEKTSGQVMSSMFCANGRIRVSFCTSVPGMVGLCSHAG